MYTCPRCNETGILTWRRWTLSKRFPTRCQSCEGLVGLEPRVYRVPASIRWSFKALVLALCIWVGYLQAFGDLPTVDPLWGRVGLVSIAAYLLVCLLLWPVRSLRTRIVPLDEPARFVAENQPADEPELEREG